MGATRDRSARDAQRGDVLVAIVPTIVDFAILRAELWYRVPCASAPRRWPPQWLAFYQPKVFGPEAFAINYNGQDVEIHHLDIVTATCERYWPDVVDFIYGPSETLDPALREVGIEPAPLPSDFMDPFERGLARYAIYGS